MSKQVINQKEIEDYLLELSTSEGFKVIRYVTERQYKSHANNIQFYQNFYPAKLAKEFKMDANGNHGYFGLDYVKRKFEDAFLIAKRWKQ